MTLRISRAALAAVLLIFAVPIVSAIGTPRSLDRAEESGEILVLFEPTVTASRTQTFAELSASGIDRAAITVRRGDAVTISVPEDQNARQLAHRLQARPDVAVAAAMPTGTVRVAASIPPNDSHYDTTGDDQRIYMGSNGTYPDSIDIETVWDATFNGSTYEMVPYRSGITLAVVDTGVNSTLRETTGEYLPGWDYAYDDPIPDDVYGHGTNVASIIRAQTDNKYGIAGVLNESTNTVITFKTIQDNGVGDAADTILALMDAADSGAKVINASLGDMAVMDAPTSSIDRLYDLTPDYTQRAAWDTATAYCASKGAIIVAASGNEADEVYYWGDTYTDVWYPAASPGSLAVGAIDPSTGIRSDFSSYGSSLDLVAAGESVWQINKNDSALRSLGTSFSTPLVSGTLALLWSLMPDASANTMRTILLNTAEDYPLAAPDGKDLEYGYGRVDAKAAYDQMKSQFATQAPVTVGTSTANRREVQVSWTQASGSGVFYRYGTNGGPWYTTTELSGRLVLPSDGPQNVNVESFAADRWSALTPGTVSASASTGRADLDSARLEGRTRWATAASVSRSSYPGGSTTAIVTSGINWPDALSSSVLARVTGAPLLLAHPEKLPIATRNELVRLSPSTVIIVGGTGAISPDVSSDIGTILPLASIRRIGGIDRYETAALIGAEVRSRQGGSIPNSRAVIASGLNFPDAISGAPLAAAAGWPILLSRTDAVPSYTTQAISGLGINNVLVLGGDGAISSSARAQLPPLTAPPLAGNDRYSTSRAIADYAQSAGVLPGVSIGLSTGLNFPDALSAGPHLASIGAPSLLLYSKAGTPSTETNWGLKSWLTAEGDIVRETVLFGGTGVIDYDTEFDLRNALRAP